MTSLTALVWEFSQLIVDTLSGQNFISRVVSEDYCVNGHKFEVGVVRDGNRKPVLVDSLESFVFLHNDSAIGSPKT